MVIGPRGDRVFCSLDPLLSVWFFLNNEEILIDARFLMENESIMKGNQIELPVHKVLIGDQISLASSDQNTKKIVANAADIPLKAGSQDIQVSPPQFNFARGAQFAEGIFKKIGHSVNFSPGFHKRPFFLVAAFGRSNFKLDVHTVSVSLQACFGASLLNSKLPFFMEESSDLLWPQGLLVLKFIIQVKFQRKILFFISCYGEEVVQIGNLRRENIIWSKIQNGLMSKDQRIKLLGKHRISNSFLSLQKWSRKISL
jgi:hypothetical protein